MNPPLSIVQLKQLKGIMQSMLAEANDANWQGLSRLDSERRVLIGYTERTRTTHDTRLDEASKDGKASPPGSQTEPGSRIKPESQARPFPESPVSTSISPVRTASNKEYVALSAELTALDNEINSTVLNARHALLEQTRVLRAQVSAKKRYEQTNTMKISSYS